MEARAITPLSENGHSPQSGSAYVFSMEKYTVVLACILFFFLLFSLPLFVVSKFMSSLMTQVAGGDMLNPNALARTASKGVEKTADLLEQITPERREELTRNFRRIAVSLQPYAEEMRPVWRACCSDAPVSPGPDKEDHEKHP